MATTKTRRVKKAVNVRISGDMYYTLRDFVKERGFNISGFVNIAIAERMGKIIMQEKQQPKK